MAEAGYAFEEREVETEDGYVLALHRLWREEKPAPKGWRRTVS